MLNRPSETPPRKSLLGGLQPYGASVPGKNADVHDLSSAKYKYDIDSVGYRVYTNKWLTGSTSIYISVGGWELIEYKGGIGNKLTLRIFDSSNKEIVSKTITIDNWDFGGNGSA
ncbi:hypothetical protein [Tissierella sp.]|uniref:hypothetical protein n=1 Tax=Tissierella sp. TaxID=41274 RepID=UPI00306FA2C9